MLSNRNQVELDVSIIDSKEIITITSILNNPVYIYIAVNSAIINFVNSLAHFQYQFIRYSKIYVHINLSNMQFIFMQTA